MTTAEGQAIADAKADEIAAMSWEDLDQYDRRTEQVTGPTGRIFEVQSSAYWDMGPWASGIDIHVKVRAERGIRRFWRYKAWRVRGGPDDPVPPAPS